MGNVVLSSNGQCYMWKSCRKGAQLQYMVLLIVHRGQTVMMTHRVSYFVENRIVDADSSPV